MANDTLPRVVRWLNYRYSRAKCTIENAFSILLARCRTFKRPARVSIETVQSIIRASVCLHNYLRTTQSSSYTLSFIDVEGFDGAMTGEYWRNIIKHDNALNSFTKAKGGGSIIQCKNCSVIFKSLLTFSNRASGMAVALNQKNRSIKKAIVFS